MAPIAVGLTLCDHVIVEEHTRKLSLIGIFSRMASTSFPYSAPPFVVHAAMTDAFGDVKVRLTLSRLDSLEVIASREALVRFTDKLRELHRVFRVHECTFPIPGAYQFTLYAEEEWVAQARLVVQREGEHS